MADPDRSALRLAGRRLLKADGHWPPAAREDVGHWSPVRLRRPEITTTAQAIAAARSYDRRLEGAARRAGLASPRLITTNPFLAAYAPLEWTSGVVYYAWDDWAAHPARRASWKLYEDAYARLASTPSGVVAVTPAIVDRIAPAGPTAVVPNGIEPREWLEPGPAPDWFLDLPRPRLVYIGSMDSRVDAAALARLAAAVPEGSLALLGRILDEEHMAPALRAPNVHAAGPRSREELVSVVSAADACALLHIRNPLTEAMSPLKVYEYLAAGRPVVATDLAPIRDVDPRVVQVDEDSDLGEALERALALGPAGEEERLAFIERNSWQQRHRELLELAWAAGTQDPPGAGR